MPGRYGDPTSEASEPLPLTGFQRVYAKPFPAPRELGYQGNRLAVMFYWMAGADELAIFDGRNLTVGMGNNELFLQWFKSVGIPMSSLAIGDAENLAQNAIVYDLAKDQIAIVDINEAYMGLRNSYIEEATYAAH